MSFDSEYEVALHHSEMFRGFMNEVATRLIERYRLRGKQVIEIGCGAGYFLRLLAGRGGVHGVGFDTSAPRIGRQQVGQGSVRFVRDYYGRQYADVPADFICCLSVFEDIAQPHRFLTELRKVIGSRPMNVYFEIFNARRAIAQQETWSIHYEQCNYFGLDCFAGVFENSGFDVLDSGGCYGNDQYIYVEAAARPCWRPTAWRPTAWRPPRPARELPDDIADFAAIHHGKLKTWNRRLQQFQREGKRVVVWGSGGKCISFLNALPSEDQIETVVDINPDRQNKYLPGTAQQVVAPQFLTAHQPDVVIMTNVLYEEEIRRQLAELGVDCELLVA